ncbi:MAG: phosphoribosylamine--glycine ligase [Candidatus Omnitrophota bacterium]|nr:phosphoribosylamine--glycine ligase [Candidatus Omnitrophota bacterium]
MKVLLIGSGGREHVLAWKIAQSPLLTKLYCAPGNGGIREVAECVAINADDIDGLLAFAKKESIDLTVVGPEALLVAGIADRFKAEGLAVFGPGKEAAQLEGSKAFAKEMMSKYNVPTAEYEVFTNENEAKHYAIEAEMPVVVKADGLAAGKGVKICESSQEAVVAISQMMSGDLFGEAGKKVVVEQLLEGEELSVLALTDGETIISLASSQDHKRAYDSDRGPNTGGMGAYSPCPQIGDDVFNRVMETCVAPLIKGLAAEGITYSGILYAGIMLTKSGPYVLEYNCRFGDPEAQVVLPRLKSDLLQVMKEVADGKLQTKVLEWHEKACLGVVMASGGYPGHYENGFVIQGISAANSGEDVFVFHAGTSSDADGKITTSGGRVLTVAALGGNLRQAYDRAYDALQKIQFDHSYYRRDIGRRAMEVLR